MKSIRFIITFFTLVALGMPRPLTCASTGNRLATGVALTAAGLAASYCLFKMYWKATPPVTENVDELHITTICPLDQTKAERGPRLDIEGLPKWTRSTSSSCILQPKPSKTLPVNAPYQVHKGLPEADEIINNTIFLYSSGWIGVSWCSGSATRFRKAGAGIVLANNWMAHGLINGTVVTFDYTTDPILSLNLGQKDDIQCLKTVYDAIVKKHPEVNIVLCGDCKGGLALLNSFAYLSREHGSDYFKRVQAIVLESVPVSLQAIAEGISYQWLGGTGANFLYHFMRHWIPNHNPQEFDTYSFVSLPAQFPRVPVLLGQVENDGILHKESLDPVIEKFKQAGCPVYRYISPLDIGHTGLSRKDPKFCNLVNAFLQKYKLPCDAQRAHQAEDLLKDCEVTEEVHA